MGDGKNAVYDPVAFGKWLSDAYDNSRFKSWQQVADEVGSSRSTLSRYAGVKRQTLTDKPSQPKPDLAINLAKIFNDDVDKVLKLAGHAPIAQEEQESLDFLVRNLPPERKKQISAIIKTFVEAETHNENSQVSENITTLEEAIAEDQNN